MILVFHASPIASRARRDQVNSTQENLYKPAQKGFRRAASRLFRSSTLLWHGGLVPLASSWSFA